MNKCITCGSPKDESHSPWCVKCTFFPNRDNTVQPNAEPTKLTRDQAIRAKALECAIISLGDFAKNTDCNDIITEAVTFEDYIRDGRKGDE